MERLMFPFEHTGEAGATLLEITVAAALMGIVAYTASTLQTRFAASSRNENARIEANTEVNALVSRMSHFWSVRNRPDPTSTDFVVSGTNFRLRTAHGGACLANCPSLEISVFRLDASDVYIKDRLTIQSFCRPPGAAAPSLGSYAAGLAGSCLTCPAQLVPTVEISSSANLEATKAFPTVLYPAGSTKPPGLRGLAACFSQTGTDPLSVAITSFVLQGKPDSVALRPITREVTLPFGNYSELNISN
jgi:hypothetical protein